MHDNSKAISSYTSQANDQEFTVIRFFIGWAVAAVVAISAYYLQIANGSDQLFSSVPLLKNALYFFIISIIFGIAHHLIFHYRLTKRSKQLDQETRDIIKSIHRKEKTLEEVSKVVIEKLENESVINSGSWVLIIGQLGAFIFGIVSLGLIIV